ncbi:MAG: Stp1/IreP family PP2C-type Ser/Thr phosphatase [Gammaproteobacteria bacterium]
MHNAFEIEIVNVSDVGMKRPHNEDSTASDLQHGLVVLADGMGGYKAGEVASAIAVATILHDIIADLQSSHPEKEKKKPATQKISGHETTLIKKAINHANSNIYKMAKQDEQCQGMGTTVVTALFHDDMVSIGHVGDSRAYRLRANKLHQLTKDHSLIQELIDRKQYTPEEAYAKMPRNLVTRGLGLDIGVEVDVYEEQVIPEDIYLVCSDGLNDMVNDEEIHLTLSKYSANLVQTAGNLVQMANSKGGKDNISVVLIRVKHKVSKPSQYGIIQKLLNRINQARG